MHIAVVSPNLGYKQINQ